MMIIRPIRAADFSALYEMAVESGHGFTSLPVNDELLQRKINRSERTFEKVVTTPTDEGYLFVLEDTQTGEICGTSAIEAAVGLDDAFYNYHLGKVVHTSRALNVYKTVDILTLCNDYTGATELCTLFLREHRRQKTTVRCCRVFVSCLWQSFGSVFLIASSRKCAVYRMKTVARHFGNGCKIISSRSTSQLLII